MRFLAVLLFLGCTSSVSRDRATYSAELNFIDRVVRDGAPANRDTVVNGCVCSGEGVWRSNATWMTDTQCAQRAEWWVVYTARWGWHRNMMQFNSGLTQTRPGATPTIPPVTCDLPVSAQ